MGSHSATDTMKSAVVTVATLLTLAVVYGHDHVIQWTITGSPVEECISPGEHVDFIWTEGHNVEQVNAEGYEDCSGITKTAPVNGNFTCRSQYRHFLLCLWCGGPLSVWTT